MIVDNTNVRIIILTNDFRLAYKLRTLLTDKFSTIRHFTDESKIKVGDVVITKVGEYSNILETARVIQFRDAKFVNLTTLMAKINNIFHLQSNFACIIGVDPGKTTGVSILIGRSIITTSKFKDFKKMLHWIKEQLKLVDFDQLIFKIGDGGGKFNEDVVDLLFKEFSRFSRLEIVNETKTSLKSSNGRSLHEEAAIRIALRYGKTINS